MEVKKTRQLLGCDGIIEEEGNQPSFFVYAMWRKCTEISDVFEFQLSSFCSISSVNFADTASMKVRKIMVW